MGIDIYQSRRTYNLKCCFYKRNENGVGNSDELIYVAKPDGVFYARYSSEKTHNIQELATVWNINFDETVIETRDIIDLSQNDIVFIRKEKWIVKNFTIIPIQKNAQFCNGLSKKMIISLRK